MASSDVSLPPPTSTSGIRCGGLKGWPRTTRSGCRMHASWNSLMVIVDVLVASGESAGAASSSLRNRSRLTSRRSGPFSWTKSTPATASSGDATNRRRSGDAPGESPICSMAAHCAATVRRNACSAPASGSVAITSMPRARNAVAQLAPMTPVPIIAAVRMVCVTALKSQAARD